MQQRFWEAEVLGSHQGSGKIEASLRKGKMGFGHLQGNHTYNFVDTATGAHTQNVENNWKNANMRNKRQHGTHRHIIDSYLGEFMWRRRHRNNNNIFARIIQDIVTHFPPQ